MKNNYLIIFCSIVISLNTSSCTRVAYYSQSVTGQWEIITKRKSIQEILQDENTSDDLINKLTPVIEIRQFARDHLKLQINNNYLTYADLGREYVVWNVFATPGLSLDPVQSCFLVVGCLSYQGFFKKESAINLANELRSQGYDVYVGGVSAYSTLGWFDDSILNTMLNKGIDYLATVLFHELVHQTIYLKNDTEFNEALAESIALTGTRQWLSEKSSKDLEKFIKQQRIEDEFVSLVLDTREKLNVIYQSTLPEKIKFQKKAEVIQALREDYQLLKSKWNDNTYDAWFENEINNAKISAVATYRYLIPAFLKVLEKTGYDYEFFYRQIRYLGQCSISQRRTILERGEIPFECTEN